MRVWLLSLMLSDSFLPYLTRFSNCLIATSSFHDEIKLAGIMSTCKKDDDLGKKSYLAISLLSLNQWIYTTLFFREAALQRCSYKKSVLKICSKFTGEHPCQSVISIKLQSNFIEIALRHGCSLVNLQHIFRTPFYKNTYEGVLLSLNFIN